MQDTSDFTLFARSIIDFSKFAKIQEQNQLNYSWEVYPEDLHGTVALPSVREGLIRLFEWYQYKDPQKYNNPDTSVEEIKQLLITQEKIYTDHFGYSAPPMIEELFSGYGYMNMQMGNPDKAKLFFEMNIKYYPSSANAYDSMAEYYENQEDYSNALKYVSRAFEINGKNYYKNRIKELKAKL